MLRVTPVSTGFPVDPYVTERSLQVPKWVYGSQAEMVVLPSIPGPQEKTYSPPTRGSTRDSGANHFTICSGSVMARKTSSGVALMSMIVSCDRLIFTPDLRILCSILLTSTPDTTPR